MKLAEALASVEISCFFAYVFSRLSSKQPRQKQKKVNESIKTHSTFWIPRKCYATILEPVWYSANNL